MRSIGFAQTQALVYGLPVRRLWIPSSHRVKVAVLSPDVPRNAVARFFYSCLRYTLDIGHRLQGFPRDAAD
jgi:hypothetical protein